MSEFGGLWKHKNNQHDLYPRRQNVAAQVAEELKMVTYATPPMEECRTRIYVGKGMSREGLVAAVVGHHVPPGLDRHLLPLAVVRKVGQVHGVRAVHHVHLEQGGGSEWREGEGG